MNLLYRSLASTRYVAFLDVDEVLVPNSKSTWHDLLTPHDKICSYQFRNTFFPLEGDDDELYKNNTQVLDTGLASLMKTKREKKIWSNNKRSKYIADVRHLIYPGIHFPWVCRARTEQKVLSPSEGLLHHYRLHPPNYKLKNKNDLVLDRTMHKYAIRLIEAANSTQKTILPFYESKFKYQTT